jgi:hypothetical protein
MDTIYDPAHAAHAAGPTHHDFGGDGWVPPGQAPALSSLDELRLAVQQSEEVAEHEFTNHDLYSPGRIIRLTCSTELGHPEWKAIQMAAIPREYRRKRLPDVRKMDESVAYAALIGRQTVAVGLLQLDGTYKTLPHEGERPFDDPNLLAQLGAAEASVAVRRIFAGRDAYLLHAGTELQEACGFGERKPGEPGDDDGDPT